MANELSCRDVGYDGDYPIRSEEGDLHTRFVQQHAMETHDTEMSGGDIRGVWSTV